jgi:hypothetical protein
VISEYWQSLRLLAFSPPSLAKDGPQPLSTFVNHLLYCCGGKRKSFLAINMDFKSTRGFIVRQQALALHDNFLVSCTLTKQRLSHESPIEKAKPNLTKKEFQV